MLLRASLKDVNQSIQSSLWVGLKNHGLRFDVAIWGAGNCILTVRKQAESITKVILHPVNRVTPDDYAIEVWNNLCARWVEFEWIREAQAEHIGLDSFWEWATEPALIELAQNPPTESEWKTKWLADHPGLESLALGDGLNKQLDSEWKNFCRILESAKEELSLRERFANRTTEEAAEEFFAWLNSQQPAAMAEGIAREIPYRFNGEIEDFWSHARFLAEYKTPDGTGKIQFRMAWTELTPSVSLRFNLGMNGEYGWVLAQRLPDGGCNVTVALEGDGEEMWQILYTRLERLGFWENGQPAASGAEGTRTTLPGLVSGSGKTIQQIAKETTSVIVGPEYDKLPVGELKHKAARFDAMRNGDVTYEVQPAPAEGKGRQAKSKRGPRKYSLAEKIKARQEWDNLDRDNSPVTLEQWLETKFGLEGGELVVPTSTFYGWPKSDKPRS